MKYSRFLMVVIFLFVGAEALAATYAFRDKELYNIYGGNTPARVTVFTFPAQPNQPVYAWREHEHAVFYSFWDHHFIRFVEGPLGYNGDYVGTTDENGILDIYVEATPDDEIYCGRYTNERFSVGQEDYPESAPISFKIYRDIGLDFGPHPIISEKCLFENL